MKKKFVKPEIEIVKIEAHPLLAGSPDLNGGDYWSSAGSGDPVLGREWDLDDY